MPQPGVSRTGRNASSSLRRMAVRREASNALQLPQLPDLPAALKRRFPAEIQEFSAYRSALEQWRLQVQSTLDQAIMALKLDKEEAVSSDDTATPVTVPGPYPTPGGGGGSSSSSPAPGTTVVNEVGWGQAPAVGTSILYSRADHSHGTPAEPTFVDDDPVPYAIALGG